MRKNRLLAIALTLCLLLTLAPAGAFASAFEDGDWDGAAPWTEDVWDEEGQADGSGEPEEDPFADGSGEPAVPEDEPAFIGEEEKPFGEEPSQEPGETLPGEDETLPTEDETLPNGENAPDAESGEQTEEEPTFGDHDAFLADEPEEEEEIADESVFVSFSAEPETALTGLVVLDAEGFEQAPYFDPELGCAQPGVYLLLPGSYSYRFHDESDTYQDVEGEFALEAFQEPAHIVLSLEQASQPVFVSFGYVNPIYADVISEADLPELSGEDASFRKAGGGDGLLRGDSTLFYSTIEEPYEDKAEAAAEIKRQVLLHETYVTLTFISDNLQPTTENLAAVGNELFQMAIAHTGVPTEGDYIRYEYGGYTFQGTAESVVNAGQSKAKFTITYAPLYFTTIAQEEELDTIAANVLDSLNLTGKTPYQKIKAIHDYLCTHVEYDHTTPTYDLMFTAYAALRNGKAVCQGYATAFYRLCLAAGVDTRIVTRAANPPTIEAHAWNIVRLGDLYYEIDATWDRDEVNGTVTVSYDNFLLGSNGWANTPHNTIGDQFNNTDFAAAYPLSAEAYTVGTAIIDSVSLVFNGTIQMKYYFAFPDTVRADPGAVLVLLRSGAEIARFEVASAEYNAASGKTIFRIGVEPAMLSTAITAKLYWGDGSEIALKSGSGASFPDGFSFSPMEYAVYMSTNGSTAEMRALAAALKDYGVAAELYFHNKDSSGHGLSSAVSTAVDTQLSSHRISVDGTLPAGLQQPQISVVFVSDNSLRIYFIGKDGKVPGNFSYQIDSHPATLCQRNNSGQIDYYTTVTNVAAAELDVPHVFSVSDGTNTYQITTDVLGYAYAAVSSPTSSAGIKTLARALYLYNAAANAYFNR